VASRQFDAARASRSQERLVLANLEPTTTTAPPPPRPRPAVRRLASVSHSQPATRRSTPPTRKPAPPQPVFHGTGKSQEGTASYYGASDGACAHNSAPMGAVLKVTNLANGRWVTCTVRSRGPYVDGRVVDLAKSTFAQLAPTSAGLINVRVEW
jgi:rare lipoprotein A (peptidoglycan hydrolase)